VKRKAPFLIVNKKKNYYGLKKEGMAPAREKKSNGVTMKSEKSNSNTIELVKWEGREGINRTMPR